MLQVWFKCICPNGAGGGHSLGRATVGCAARREGEGYAEAVGGVGSGLGGAVVGGGYGGDDGQAQAGAGAVRWGGGSVEAVEDMVEPGGGDAGAVVGDLDGQGAAVASGTEGGGGAGRGVRGDVGEQVVDGAAQLFFVARGDQALGEAGPPAVRGVGSAGPLDAFAGQRGQVDGGMLGFGMLVEPGQPEHVVYQQAHPLGFGGDPAHRLVHLRALGEGALLVELGVGAQ